LRASVNSDTELVSPTVAIMASVMVMFAPLRHREVRILSHVWEEYAYRMPDMYADPTRELYPDPSTYRPHTKDVRPSIIMGEQPSYQRMSSRSKDPKCRPPQLKTAWRRHPIEAMPLAVPHTFSYAYENLSSRWNGTTSALGLDFARKATSTSRPSTSLDRSSPRKDLEHVDLSSLQDNRQRLHDGQPTRSPRWIDAFTLSSVSTPAGPSPASTEQTQHECLDTQHDRLKMLQASSANIFTVSDASPLAWISSLRSWLCHNCPNFQQPDRIHLL
jgi:hypothetical protein